MSLKVETKLPLYEHQINDIQQMMEIEQNPFRIFNVGFLAEQTGVGKTSIIISLILNSNPVVMQTPTTFYDSENVQELFLNDNDYVSPVKINRKLKNVLSISVAPKNIFRQTVVLCAKSVGFQWISEIKKFSDLRAFLIYSNKDLKTFQNLLETGKISEIDVIVIVNMKTQLFDGLDPVDYRNSRVNVLDGYILPKIVDVFQNITTNFRITWARYVIDDYDMLSHVNKNTKSLTGVSAVISWLVSGTYKKINNCEIDNANSTIEMALEKNFYNFCILNYTRSNYIVRSAKFDKKTLVPAEPIFKTHTYSSIANNLFNDILTPEIIDLINDGDYAQASVQLGIQEKTNLPSLVRAIINAKKSPNFYEIIKSNINHNTCLICYGNFVMQKEDDIVDSPKVIILMCCGQMTHQSCFMTGIQKNFIRECPQCRNHINIQTSILIFDNNQFENIKTLNLEDIKDSDLPKFPEEEKKVDYASSIISPKIKKVFEIINPNKKTLIFTKFLKYSDAIYKNLVKIPGITPRKFIGNSADLGKCSEELQQGKINVLISTFEYLAGVNFQFADEIIIASSMDNREFTQCVSRIQRFGRVEPFVVHLLKSA